MALDRVKAAEKLGRNSTVRLSSRAWMRTAVGREFA